MNIIGITFDIFYSFVNILIYFSSCTVVIYAYYFVFSFINEIIYQVRITKPAPPVTTINFFSLFVIYHY